MEYVKSISDTGEWVEEDHPRNKNGQFTSGAGESKTPDPLESLAKSTIPQEHETETETECVERNVEHTHINKSYIASPEYKKRFKALDLPPKVIESLQAKCISALFHRSGTLYEDMFLINRFTGNVDGAQVNMHTEEVKDKTGKVIQKGITQGVVYSEEMKQALKSATPGTHIAIHNHPESRPPSGDDIERAYKNKYHIGVVACHNGDIYCYQVPNEITQKYFDTKVDKRAEKIYTDEVDKIKDIKARRTKKQCELQAYYEILDLCAERYGLRWWKL